MTTQRGIVDEILQERRRQDLKWGDQSHHPDLYWLGILVEEVGEVAKDLIELDPTAARGELVQVAAVAISWIESMDRRDQ